MCIRDRDCTVCTALGSAVSHPKLMSSDTCYNDFSTISQVATTDVFMIFSNILDKIMKMCNKNMLFIYVFHYAKKKWNEFQNTFCFFFCFIS